MQSIAGSDEGSRSSCGATVQRRLDAGELAGLLVDDLGWDFPSLGAFPVELDDVRHEVTPIAQKAGLHVLSVTGPDGLPALDVQARVDRAVADHVNERLLVFVDGPRQVWRWPEHRKGGGVRLVPHEYVRGEAGTALVQRLAAVEFTMDDEGRGLTLPDVRDRVRGTFDAEVVTRRFHERFEGHHGDLLRAIEGVPEEEERRSYASRLMNRLMFIWFLQKKGFLNEDREYLRTCLRRVRDLRGPDRFSAFYRELLLALLHSGFGAPPHLRPDLDPEIAEIVGDVPHLNGGLFEVHPVEAAHDIQIRDAHFERIFDFFDDFAWHLDDRPTGRANEVNPDVIGYIFERYINFTASGRRANGAYYTKEDVTGYMASATVVARLLDRVGACTSAQPAGLIRSRTRRYVHETLKHGTDPVSGEWLPLPEEAAAAWPAVERWGELDELERDETLLLAGETWVEALERRAHVDGLVAHMARGELTTTADAVRENLDVRTLLLDVLDALDRPEDVLAAWRETTATRVIDPTCGSGAFLFAALEVFDEVYEHLVMAARRLARTGPDARDTMAEMFGDIDGHGTEAYALRRHAALHNLYGVDLMAEAVEIAKLRLFLSMAATLQRREEVRALPDLDFNLRAGNLLVGFRDAADAQERLGTVDLMVAAEVEHVMRTASVLGDRRSAFLEAQRTGEDLAAAKSELGTAAADFASRANEIHAGVTDGSESPEAWAATHRPLHWFVEFPDVAEAGGFDVVLGNPPYVARADIDYPLIGYASGDAHDVYLPCVERSVGLVREGGMFAMVVPHSICFRPGPGKAVRDLLERRFGLVLASTYAKRPDSLFSGVQVRNAIVIGLTAEGRSTCVTRHMVWPSAARPWMLDGLRYSELAGHLTEWPRVPSPSIAFSVLGEPLRTPPRAATGEHEVYFRRTSQYWVPVLADAVPIYTAALERQDNPHLSTLRFPGEDQRLVALGILAGKLGYLWWSMFGDDFNVTGETLLEAIAAFSKDLEPSAGLLELLAKLDDAMQSPEHRMWTMNRYWVGNVDLLALRGLTDEVDRILLTEAGHPDQMWRDIQVWYRQAMRSTRRANNAVFAATPPGAL